MVGKVVRAPAVIGLRRRGQPTDLGVEPDQGGAERIAARVGLRPVMQFLLGADDPRVICIPNPSSCRLSAGSTPAGTALLASTT